MRTVTRGLATACLLSAAFLVAGCGGDGEADTGASGEIFLQPAADQGPDPFTDSTAVPSTGIRTPEPDPSTSTTATGRLRAVSGALPGLYAGTARVGSCDVDRQIGRLTADRARERAFAAVAGVSPASVAAYLRGLAPVVLRADTQVTNHGYRGGRTTSFQSVLQAGTAVLVDNRGVPRVRCACGNPLQAASATGGGGRTASGRAWAGYRPAEVIVVTPSPRVITDLTIIDVADNTWIERHVGHDVDHDHAVPPPATLTPRPDPTTPSPDGSDSGTGRGPGSASPSDEAPAPSDPTTDCATPAPTVTVTPGATDDPQTAKPSADDPQTAKPSVDDPQTAKPSATPGDCPTATATAPGATTPAVPGRPQSSPAAPSSPREPAAPDSPDGTGPETVPDSPDVPDGGGLIPDSTATSIVFHGPTGVLRI